MDGWEKLKEGSCRELEGYKSKEISGGGVKIKDHLRDNIEI